MAVEIVLQHFRCAAIVGPQHAVHADVQQMDVGWIFAETPIVFVIAVGVEDLHTMIGAVVHKHSTRLRVNGDAVHVVHIVRTLVVRRRALHAPGLDELAFFIKFGHARSVVAVGNEQRTIGHPGDKRWTIEMRSVVALHGCGADGLHQRFAVVREFVDGVHMVIHHPHVLFGIVGIDGDVVRTLHDFVPLRPGFDDLAVAVDYGYAMLPLGVNSDGALPKLGAIIGILPRATSAWQC